MINYVTDLIKIATDIAKDVPVTTTYPETNIVPIIVLYESEQISIYRCSEYEHAASTITIEIIAKDIPTRNNLKNDIDEFMRDLKYELTKKDDIDNAEAKIYACKLIYQCEIIQRDGSVHIYSRKNN